MLRSAGSAAWTLHSATVQAMRGQSPALGLRHPQSTRRAVSRTCSTADLGVAERTVLLHLYVHPPRSLEERQGEQARPSSAMPAREPSSDGHQRERRFRSVHPQSPGSGRPASLPAVAALETASAGSSCVLSWFLESGRGALR